jgi:periplasmic protein TonB
MQTAAHTMPPMPPPGLAQRRATGLFFAILLQAGLIAALIAGLDIKVWPKPDDGIETTFIPTKPTHPPPPQPVNGGFIEPKPIDVTQPKIVFDTGDDDSGRIHPGAGNTYQPGPADHGPVSIARTHTVPPYPALYARLGSQGTVILRLTISVQGVVTDAAVIRSSGTEGLDEVARMWVLQHWRYQPAIRGGVAAPGAVTVGVEFNLKNAG